MKVLHILSIAGVPSIISFFFNKLEKGQSQIFYLKKNDLSTHIANFYDGREYSRLRYLIASGILQSHNYDIIHIHGEELLIPFFKISGKKIVLHYHGSDIRRPERSVDKKRIFARSLADLIVYNAKSMEKKIITKKKVKKEFLPNLIDTDHFFPRENNRKGNLSVTSSNHDKIKDIKTIKEQVGMCVTLQVWPKVMFTRKLRQFM